MMSAVESDPARTLVFKCPHCGVSNRIAAASVGTTVMCLNEECGQQFRVQAPTGQLVRDGDRNAVEPDMSGQESDVPPTERELASMHPAMFGNHPFYFIGCLILVGGGIAGMVIAGGTGEMLLVAVGAVAAVVGGLILGAWWLQTRFRSVIVTSKRTIYRKGIFSKQTSEVQHDDVRNMKADQSLFDRLVGVGHVAISSSGQDEMEIDVRGLKSPNKVIEIIREYQ